MFGSLFNVQIERAEFEVIIENGKLLYKQSGKSLETVNGCKYIFVLSTSKILYVGAKKKGQFQHSSFLSGGAATAAGRLVAHNGVLEVSYICYCNRIMAIICMQYLFSHKHIFLSITDFYIF